MCGCDCHSRGARSCTNCRCHEPRTFLGQVEERPDNAAPGGTIAGFLPPRGDEVELSSPVDLRALADLPDWVWDLLDALDRYENEHPILYRLNTASEFERAPCTRDILDQVIPSDVFAAARIYRAGKARHG